MIKRFALMFADGSLSILPDGTTKEEALGEVEECDRGLEQEDQNGTKVVRLEFEVVEIV